MSIPKRQWCWTWRNLYPFLHSDSQNIQIFIWIISWYHDVVFFHFAVDICAQPLSNCPGAEMVFTFDVSTGNCRQVTYDNCQDTGNVFENEAECVARCIGTGKFVKFWFLCLFYHLGPLGLNFLYCSCPATGAMCCTVHLWEKGCRGSTSGVGH